MTGVTKRRTRLGLWQRLMLLIGATVVVMWLALALASVIFARFQTEFSTLSASQIPRIALTGELAGYSAQLAGISTRIIADEGDSGVQLAQVAVITARLKDILNGSALKLSANTDQPDVSVRTLQQLLITLPPLYEKRQTLAESIAQDVDALRWLNVDIQDEIEPLLNDYDFNTRTRMLDLQKQDDAKKRAVLIEQLTEDAKLRDQMLQIGSNGAIAITLLLQMTVAADERQAEQLSGLIYDLLDRLKEQVEALPNKAEFLTIRQSVSRLSEISDSPDGLIARRLNSIRLQSDIYANTQAIQDGVTQLQDYLARLSLAEKQRVLTSISETAKDSRFTMAGLVILTLVMGIVGLAVVFGVMRKRIIMPLRILMSRMLMIAEKHDATVNTVEAEDEIRRIRSAVDAFDHTIDELQKTQEELVQAGKMAALGTLSAGISHELNQPLAALQYRLVLLKTSRDAGNEAETERQIERIAELTNRMEAIISHLRRFARRSDRHSERLSLGEPIHNALSLLQGRIDQSGAVVTVSSAAGAQWILADQILTEQVIINLLSNALDAIAEKGRDGKIHIDALRDGNYVDLTIRDNGIGLGDLTPEEALNPFVTSKEAGRGMGLGLSISYNIAKDMGGTLTLSPAPDQGVEARLQLLASD